MSFVSIVTLAWGLGRVTFDNQVQISLSVTSAKYIWYSEAWPSHQEDDDPNLCETKIKWHQIGKYEINVYQPTACTSAPFLGHRLYVIGDSHAGAYSTLFRMLVERRGLEVRLYSKGGCSVASLLAPISADCANLLHAALEEIRTEARPGDILFLASLRMNRFGDQWARFPDSQVKAAQQGNAAEQRHAAALAEAKTLLKALDGTGLHVVFSAPTPIFQAPAFRCSDWFNRGNPDCAPGLAMDRNQLLQHRRPVIEALEALGSFRPISVWDPFDVLCPHTTCTAFDQTGKPLFFDGDHLSAHGNRILYPSFAAYLARLF